MSKLSTKQHAGIGVLLTLILGALDYWTGFEFRVEIFYLIPIAYLTWFVNQKAGLAVAVLSLVTILATDIMAGKNYYNISIEAWNMAMLCAFFVVVTVLINSLRDVIARLQKSLSEVKELRGIIPICANCKKIRDDQGYWNDVAVYISKNTNAEFTHGLCQDCAEKLYPQLFKNGENSNGKA